ncbi:hypothetical protein [Paenibacillus alvei]|jgi:hypothetical protein|uniref:hypothetical protein n=1 Tax=Paenibacillus alvei TaxID=44250 RepID=UPI0003F72F4E|nr:hypothetical protein [Paenibacillus alvei]
MNFVKNMKVLPETFHACASLQEQLDAIVPHKYIVGIGSSPAHLRACRKTTQ